MLPINRTDAYTLVGKGENGFKNSNESSNELTNEMEDRMYRVDLVILSAKLT